MTFICGLPHLRKGKGKLREKKPCPEPTISPTRYLGHQDFFPELPEDDVFHHGEG